LNITVSIVYDSSINLFIDHYLFRILIIFQQNNFPSLLQWHLFSSLMMR